MLKKVHFLDFVPTCFLQLYIASLGARSGENFPDPANKIRNRLDPDLDSDPDQNPELKIQSENLLPLGTVSLYRKSS